MFTTVKRKLFNGSTVVQQLPHIPNNPHTVLTEEEVREIVNDELDALGSSSQPSGSSVYDPGDLTLYFSNSLV